MTTLASSVPHASIGNVFPRVSQAVAPLAVGRMTIASFLVIALLLVNKAGPPGNLVFFGILVALTAQSPVLAFKALTINFLGLVANQAIVQKNEIWTVARFVIPAICLARFIVDIGQSRQSRFGRGYVYALAAFIGVAGILSVASQYFVEIALMKLLNFAIVSFAIFTGIHVLRSKKVDMTEWYMTICLTTVLMGLGTLATGTGYNMRRTVQSFTFNGPFYHSNCLGPMAAMMVVYMSCVGVFGRVKNRWLCVVLSLALLVFMRLTQSRTAFGSMLVGLFFLLATSMLLVRKGYLRLNLNLRPSSLMAIAASVLLLGLVVDVATGQSISRGIVGFINKSKSNTEEINITQVISSRQDIVEGLWQNFLDSPLIGIGFEVSKSEFFQRNATLFYAPIEKGFLPMAILEETGLIGTSFFVLFLLAFIWHLRSTLNAPGLIMLLTFLAVNCGESMFFAVAGHGGFAWLLFAGGVLLGDQCVIDLRCARPRRAYG